MVSRTGGLLALLVCQLVGTFLATLLHLPLPGPVLGMVLLLVALQARPPAPDAGVVAVADGLLAHLQLLFVPAGVGVVQYLPLIGAAAVPLAAGLLVSWAAALVASAAVMVLLLRLTDRRRTTGSGR